MSACREERGKMKRKKFMDIHVYMYTCMDKHYTHFICIKIELLQIIALNINCQWMVKLLKNWDYDPVHVHVFHTRVVFN